MGVVLTILNCLLSVKYFSYSLVSSPPKLTRLPGVALSFTTAAGGLLLTTTSS
jgi:hypothetical protein